MTDFLLPQYGMGMSDGTILEWFKSPGERVAKDEALLLVEAAKTTVEIQSPWAGTLIEILANVGETVLVNTPIARFETDGEKASTPVDVTAEDASTDSPPSHINVRHGASAAVRIEPRARRVAAELGVDLSSLVGSGPEGRITEADVRTAAAGSQPTPIAASVSVATALVVAEGNRPREVPHTTMRTLIARRLTESKQQVPHFYVKATCRADALIAARERLVAGRSVGKISLNDLLVRAVALAMRQVPAANVAWTETAMWHFEQVDVAVAVAAERGLLTPIVRKADTKNLSALSAELKELTARAKRGQLLREEYLGGTVTVSNLGMFGVEEFTAILNPPQAVIFALGAAESRALVIDGAVIAANVITCTLSVDHRAVDGALAAKLLAAFKRLVESPEPLLA